MNWWAFRSRFDKNNLVGTTTVGTTTAGTTDVKEGTATDVRDGTGTGKAVEVETTADNTVPKTGAHRSKTALAGTVNMSTTIGPAHNATIPTLRAAPRATDVKHHGQTTAEVHETTDRTTEEAPGTTVDRTVDLTVATMDDATTDRTTEEALETIADRTVDLTVATMDDATTVKTEGPSTATIGLVQNATTRISRSAMPATVAKHLVQVAAVVAVVAATEENNALAKIETERNEEHRTATTGGHEASDKVTLTINHPGISENRRNLSGNVTIEARQ